jgi:hypothetical protein
VHYFVHKLLLNKIKLAFAKICSFIYYSGNEW